MKKQFMVLFVCVLSFTLMACQGLGISNGAKIPGTPNNLLLFDDELIWDGGSLADAYNIYVDDVYVDQVTETAYVFTSATSVDQAISISSVNIVGDDVYESEKSIELIRYKNNFLNSEMMIFDLRTQYGEPLASLVTVQENFTIANHIRYVKIIGNQGVHYRDLSFYITSRNLPLIIDIENAMMEASYDHSVIYTDRPLEGDYWVTINSLGDYNELNAGLVTSLGTAGSNASVLFATGGDGGDGINGLPAIALPRVIFKGTADLNLSGGIGGIGGRGGNGNVNFGGNGGDGGDGGYGAEFIQAYIKMDASSIIRFIGGYGGEGGKAGNSTPLTSPKDGDFGDQGGDYTGALNLISGIIG